MSFVDLSSFLEVDMLIDKMLLAHAHTTALSSIVLKTASCPDCFKLAIGN